MSLQGEPRYVSVLVASRMPRGKVAATSRRPRARAADLAPGGLLMLAARWAGWRTADTAARARVAFARAKSSDWRPAETRCAALQNRGALPPSIDRVTTPRGRRES